MGILSKLRRKKESDVNSDKRVWKSAKDCPYEYIELLPSGNYRWKLRTFKKVILVNSMECKHIKVRALEEAWAGMGHVEWELLLVDWLAKALREAIKNNESEADISALFNKEFSSEEGITYSRDQVHEHILSSFEIISETEDELKLKLKVDELEKTP